MKSKYTTIALVASLMVNAFLIGRIALPMPHGFHDKHDRPNPKEMLFRAADHLQPEYRDNVKTIIRSHSEKIDSAVERDHATMMEVHKILTSPETVDRAKIQALFKTMGTANSERTKGIEAITFAFLDTIKDDAERARFFENILPKDFGPDRHNKGGKGKQPPRPMPDHMPDGMPEK